MAASLVRGFFGGPGRFLNSFTQPFLLNGSRNLTSVCSQHHSSTKTQLQTREAFTAPSLLPLSSVSWPLTSIRTKVNYSLREGKPKTVKAVVGRFLRLDWGIYIRPRAGRNKKKWKKPDWINERGQYHVFCNKTQSKMLDKMSTRYWHRKRNYVDDPYERYQRRFGMKEHKAPKFLP